MIAYRIQIIKAGLPTFWYSNHTGETYWVIPRYNTLDDNMSYEIIQEGVFNEKHDGTKWVNKDDCIVLKEADITVKKVTMVQVIQNA